MVNQENFNKLLKALGKDYVSESKKEDAEEKEENKDKLDKINERLEAIKKKKNRGFVSDKEANKELDNLKETLKDA